jgi:hypothetical protein
MNIPYYIFVSESEYAEYRSIVNEVDVGLKRIYENSLEAGRRR